MIELLKHELYKIYSRKVIYITLLFFALIIVYFSHSDISMSHTLYGNPNEFYNMFRQYEGRVTPYKIQMAEKWQKEQNYDKYWTHDSNGRKITLNVEGNRKSAIFAQVRYANENMLDSNNELKRLQHQMVTIKNKYTYHYRNTSLYYNMLKKLQPAGIYITMWGGIGIPSLFDYLTVMGTVVMGAMLLLGISPIFSDEYATNMDSIILSAKNGKRPVITAKILASCIYILSIGIFITLLQFIIQIIGFGKIGTIGWNYPIQATIAFFNSPYNYKFAQYIFIHLGVYLFGSFALGMIVLLISVFSKSSLIPLFVGGGIFSIPIFLSQIIGMKPVKGLMWYILKFNYTELMKVRGMFNQFITFNVFGYPMLYANIMLILFTLLTVIAIILIYKTFSYHQVC